MSPKGEHPKDFNHLQSVIAITGWVFFTSGEMGHSRSLVGAWPVHLRAHGFAVAMDAPSRASEEQRMLRRPFWPSFNIVNIFNIAVEKCRMSRLNCLFFKIVNFQGTLFHDQRVRQETQKKSQLEIQQCVAEKQPYTK